MVLVECVPLNEIFLLARCAFSVKFTLFYLIKWSFVAVFIFFMYSATGIFLHQKGPNIRFMTIWFASASELKILRI